MKKTITTLGILWASICILISQPSTDQLLSFLKWRNIGPGNFSGRIIDVEALESDFTQVWAASASGGVWKSENAGTTWEPIFDHYGAASIGDIKVYQQNPNLIWVGTGEANNRNSVAWGDGIYKSTDGGKSFQHMGLEKTYQISRIAVHPKNPDVVFAAAAGYLWGYIGERGLFKTTNGGKSWSKLTNGLPDDDKTGAIDLVMHPTNPDVLFVAMYQRHRWPYKFESGGPNGGIYKSKNGGKSWTKITKGLPEGPTGRIGLDICRSNPNVLLAIVEHGNQPKPYEQEYNDLKSLGTGIYRSEDGGNSWSQVNRYNNRPFYYSQIRVNPTDDQRVYVLSTSIQLSEDGGKTFKTGGVNFEGGLDYHGLWIDPNNGDRYYLAKDKGLTLTHDHGEHFQLFDNIPVGQFYAAGVDMRDPYYVYGGTQDNGTWGGPSFSKDTRGIQNDSWWKLHWGDGMFIQIDPNDWRVGYTEAENASFRRYNIETREVEYDRPGTSNIINIDAYYASNADFTANLRFNWRSPMVMSKHNTQTLYLCGNHLFKTIDQGHQWMMVSPDLSTKDPMKYDRKSGGLTSDITGAETHCSITAFSESPINPDVLWTGTDDGNIHVTQNGGADWSQVNSTLPNEVHGIWISHVEASHTNPATAYLTIDGHRSAILGTFIFKTEDFGQSWKQITTGIPDGQVMYVIREDQKNNQLLFAGSEFACFVSLDGGENWQSMMERMPTVATHDLIIHPRDGDLIAATHGRAFWILDGIEPLQQLNNTVTNQPFHFFDGPPMTLWNDLSRGGVRGHAFYGGENPPEIPFRPDIVRAKMISGGLIHYYLRNELASNVNMTISTLDGSKHRALSGPGTAGIHRVQWDFRFTPSQESIANFKKRASQRFDALLALPNMSADHKKMLESYRTQFLSSENPTQLNEISSKVASLYQHERSMRQYRIGSINGDMAKPGFYELKTTINGQVYSKSIEIREDPMEGW